MNEQARGFSEHGAITRAQAPVSGVSVPAHMGVGTDLVDGLDYVVLLQVFFDVASAAEVTPLKVWERLKERGIRSTKNRDELVGRNSVYESFARIIAAGYLLRVELPNEKRPGRKGRIAYKLYDNPAWNPAWQARHVGSDPLAPSDAASKEPQVGTLPGIREAVNRDVENAKKSAGQNASRNEGSGVAGSLVPGSGGRRVPAGQNASPVPGSVKAPPPHPPGEVGTTSPSPHKNATASRRSKQAAPDVAPEAAATAAKFLRNLPGKWAAGLQRAESLAPWLVRNAELTGWELDMALRIYLTHQEDGQKPPTNYGNVLGYRIKNMQPREAVMAAAAEEKQGQAAGSKPSASGMPEWCGECNNGERPAMVYMRVVPSTDPDDDSAPRCPRCHPAMARRT
ncbi:hypothetical protein [Streptomyces sp. A1277]|uniref:hypothetical protein n=1 Tax=Streptomyces sp. A1277 TaxID=2563103 RepID=UPI0019D025A7|nr:hypothetical protein [Streptomyces sp. A1277]